MNKGFFINPNLVKCDTYKKMLDHLIDHGWNKSIKLDQAIKYLLCYQHAKEIGVEEKEFHLVLTINDLMDLIRVESINLVINDDNCEIIKQSLISDYIAQVEDDLARTKEVYEQGSIDDYDDPIDPDDIVTIKKEN